MEKKREGEIGEEMSSDGASTVAEEDDEENKDESSSSSDDEKYSKHSSDNEDGEADTDKFSLDQIRKQFQHGLHVGEDDAQTHPHVLDDISLDGIIEYIKQGRAKNIIVMSGAGVSTSAGVPDFRSPGTGLYANLQKYNLPNSSAIFDIRYFLENPKPFYVLAKELYPAELRPTPTHHFINLLNLKQLLLRNYTQNIDTLERLAGLEEERLVEAHGTFHNAHCVKCNKEYSEGWLKERILGDQVPRCDPCQGLVKPDIVFFGESLPQRFFDCVETDLAQCDLLVIMGSSLVVQPFASLIDRVKKTCPRLLINREKAGIAKDLGRMFAGEGLMYDSPGNYRDVYLEADTDSASKLIAEKLGWREDLERLIATKPKL